MSVVWRGLLFAVSNLGWWEGVRVRTGVDERYLPSLTVAVQVTILVLGGILNLLAETSLLLFASGLFAFLCSIRRNHGLGFLRTYLTPAFLFLGLWVLIIAAVVKGKQFAHYDNFSHWALVVREMLLTNRFPSFRSELIRYPEYPLGSSSYIYYWAYIVGSSESLQMLAQSYAELVCVLPLFTYAKRNRLASSLVIIAATNLFLVYNISVADLLVDTLLPLVGMCALLFSRKYCGKDGTRRAIPWLGFYAVQLVQIKNSGLFFAILLWLNLLVNLRREYLQAQLSSLLAAPFSLLLWHRHCRYVLEGAEGSKHALTGANLIQIFQAKDPETVRTICSSMLKFAVGWRDLRLFVLVFLGLGFLIFFFAKMERRSFTRLFLLSLALYVCYQVGLLAMYLFSMPTDEALTLAGNIRYARTIILAVMYLATVCAIKLASAQTPPRRLLAFVFAVVTSFVFLDFVFHATGRFRFVLPYQGDTTERVWIQDIQNKYQLPNGESYCILIPEYDYGYTTYLSRYLFWSPYSTGLVIDDEQKLDRLDVQYLLNYDPGNPIIQKWISAHYPDRSDSQVIMCHPKT